MPQPKLLTPEQIKSFREKGYTAPVRVMSTEEALAIRARLEAFEKSQGQPLKGDQRAKTYLLFKWAYEVLTHPKVVDAVEDLIGPDILVYHWTSWIKEARSPSYVSWHQDATYFGLEPLDQVTAWVALTPTNTENGALHVLPGSHKLGQLKVEHVPHKDNLLSSGQLVQHKFSEADTVELPLQPGEMSLHHTCTIHGSHGNNSADRRIGFCIDYIPAHVRPNRHLVEHDGLCSALLVRGKTHHDLFPLEPAPTGDADPVSIDQHAAGVASYRRMVKALGHMTASRFD